MSQAGGLCRYSGYYSKPATGALFRNVAFGSKATSEEGPLLAKRTLAKAAMSEKCQNSEMVFGGSGLQATSKGEKLTSN